MGADAHTDSMASRLKVNPDRTFHWFFEASCPVARDQDPGVLFQFPDNFNDEESRQSLPRFCFPFDIQRVRDGVAVQHFTFVLTDLEGCQRFGFCRLNNNSQTSLCILSYLPWFEVFYKLLNNLADYLTKGQTNEMRELLSALYKQPIPLAAGSVTLQMVPYFIAPDPNTLPSIPENRNLTELVVAVDVGNLLHLYASMLFERRILILASKLSTLTACVHALSAVLYPMYWQHIFIPVLPPHLLDYCCAPMPFLIGVHSSLTEKVRSRGLEDVVILNVDTNTLETPFEDLKRIPSNVVSGLKVRLKQQASSAGGGVSRAFLRAQARLFGGYRDAVQAQEGDLRFSDELFVEHRSPSMRQFLQSAVHLQFFKQFIDGRMELLSKGKEPDDLFEEEILLYETGTGSNKSYQQLVGNLKKGSGALMLNVKTKAHTTAKGFTKHGLRSLLTSKDQSEKHSLQRGSSVSETNTLRRFQSDCLQSRLPITQHFGKSRPRRPVHRHRGARQEDDTEENTDMWDSEASRLAVVTHIEAQTVGEGEEEEEEEGASLLSDPEEMDLLGEIFDTLSSRSSHERGLLYGTRSLDLFGPECHDYITKRSSATPSQESLSLSVTGSGSLHSWNLEEGLCSTAEVADVEECDRLPDGCNTEESRAGATDGLGEEPEVGKGMVGIDVSGKEKDSGRYHASELVEKAEKEKSVKNKWEGKDEPEGEKEKQIGNKGLGHHEEGDKRMVIKMEGKEDVTGAAEREATHVQKDEMKEEQEGLENQKEGDPEVSETLPRNGIPMLGIKSLKKVIDTVDSLNNLPTEPPSFTFSKCSIALEETGEEGREKEERGVGRTPFTPKVVSAAARFQTSRQSAQVKVQTRGLFEHTWPITTTRESSQWGSPVESSDFSPGFTSVRDDPSELNMEDELPLVKVSELKKRFEA